MLLYTFNLRNVGANIFYRLIIVLEYIKWDLTFFPFANSYIDNFYNNISIKGKSTTHISPFGCYIYAETMCQTIHNMMNAWNDLLSYTSYFNTVINLKVFKVRHDGDFF